MLATRRSLMEDRPLMTLHLDVGRALVRLALLGSVVVRDEIAIRHVAPSPKCGRPPTHSQSRAVRRQSSLALSRDHQADEAALSLLGTLPSKALAKAGPASTRS